MADFCEIEQNDVVKELSGKSTARKRDVYSAVRWSAASKYGSQIVQFGVSILLARLLAPEYFGLLGMAAVITGFAKTLKNLGFNAAIVQRKDLDHALLSTLFWVNLGFCTFVTLMLIVASPLAFWVYHDNRITPILAVLSLNIFINSFCTVPSALLQRRLEFKKLAVREIGGVIASGATGISCALLGWGVWTRVAASLASSITSMILLNFAEPFYPARVLDRERLKDCLKFGLNITGFNIFNYFARNADNLIIGIFLGPVALGYYSLAYKFMLLPRNSISRVVTRVLFPKLSKLQDKDDQLAEAYQRTCRAIAFVTFPLMAGLAVLADPFVSTVLGDKWLPAVLAIQILAPIGAIQSIGTTTGQLFLAKGRSDIMFQFSVIASAVRVASFVIGVQWGIAGVAVCYSIVTVPLFVINIYLASRLVETLDTWRFLSSLGRPLLAAIGCGAVTITVQSLFASMIDSGLLIAVLLGALFYIASSYFVSKRTWIEVSQFVLPRQIFAVRNNKSP